MVHIGENYLKPCVRRQELPLCQVSGGLQEGCRADIWCAPISICCCPVPRSDLVERSNVGSHDLHVILHNMIIESEQEEPILDIEPYYRQGPLAQVDHQLPATWVAFLNMRQEIGDPQVHQELQHDPVEHLWRLKGNA